MVRTEDEMGLRVAETPESVMPVPAKKTTLAWVIISRNTQPAVPVGLVFSLFIPIFIAMLRLFPVA